MRNDRLDQTFWLFFKRNSQYFLIFVSVTLFFILKFCFGQVVGYYHLFDLLPVWIFVTGFTGGVVLDSFVLFAGVLLLYLLDKRTERAGTFLDHRGMQELECRSSDILTYFQKIVSCGAFPTHNAEGTLNSVGEGHADVVEHDCPRGFLLIRVEHVGALGQLEVGIFSGHQLWEKPALEEILGLLFVGRSVGEDVGLRGVAVEIQEHFDLPGELSLEGLEQGDDALDLGEQLLHFRIASLVVDPVPVEIVAEYSSTVVAHNHAVDVDHRDHVPADEVIIFVLAQPGDEAFHHPRPHSLTRVLPGYGYPYHPGLSLGFEEQVGDFGAHYGLAQPEFFAGQSADKLVQMQKGIGRLAAELYLVVIVLEVEAELKAKVLSLLVLVEFNLALDLPELVVVGVLERTAVGSESLAVQHGGFNEVLDGELEHAAGPLDAEPEVEPLEMVGGVGVRFHVHVVLVDLAALDDLHVARLELRLEFYVLLPDQVLVAAGREHQIGGPAHRVQRAHPLLMNGVVDQLGGASDEGEGAALLKHAVSFLSQGGPSARAGLVVEVDQFRRGLRGEPFFVVGHKPVLLFIIASPLYSLFPTLGRCSWVSQNSDSQ